MPSHGSALLHFAFAERGYSFAQRVYPCIAFAVLRQSFAMLCCHRPAIAALVISMPLPVTSTLCNSAAYLFTAVPSLPVALLFVPQQCLRSAILSVTKPLRCQTLLCLRASWRRNTMPLLRISSRRASLPCLAFAALLSATLCLAFALPVCASQCHCTAVHLIAFALHRRALPLPSIASQSHRTANRTQPCLCNSFLCTSLLFFAVANLRKSGLRPCL